MRSNDATGWGDYMAVTAAWTVVSGAAFSAAKDLRLATGNLIFTLNSLLGGAGDTLTVQLQHSDDNGVADPYTSVSGKAFDPITDAQNVRQYITAHKKDLKRFVRFAYIPAGAAPFLFIVTIGLWSIPLGALPTVFTQND